jgi:protein-arginine kinase activator protein McsA
MPLCVKCRKSKRKMVCFECYETAIEELTTILERVESGLRAATVKTELLQKVVHCRLKAAKRTKETKLVVLSDSVSSHSNKATGT